jgi:outer membrane protein assembly factor BamB
MELTNRAARLYYVDGVGLLVTDVVGRLHLLDEDLRLIRSSSVIPGARAGFSIAVQGDWVVTKDQFGNLTKWSLETLDAVDYVDSQLIRDESKILEGEEPSPVVHRGLAIWNDRVYTNNGYFQFVVLDLETFAVEEIRESPTGQFVPIEWISTDCPTVHAIADKRGNLYLGSLDTLDFPVRVQVDAGLSLHRVRYDAKFDRFWVTQDGGDDDNYNVANGVATVLLDGTIEQVARFAADDVEFLTLSRDGKRVYTGGFDGVLHVFDNSERELRVERTVECFSHQLIDGAMSEDDDLFLLGQDGEIVKLTPEGEFLGAAPFRRQCVWDIQRSLEDPETLYCATDDGVAVVRAEGLESAASAHVRLVEHCVTGYGFVRRVLPVDGGWLGITRDERVFRAQSGGGRILWTHELEARAQTIATDPTRARAVVATNAGAIILDAETGAEVQRIDFDGLPIWACTYLPDGAIVLCSRNGTMVAFEPDGETRRWSFELENYPKRMWAQDGSLFVTGGDGLTEIAADGSRALRNWSELLNNTAENAVVADGAVYIVTYGTQLSWFDYASGEVKGVYERLLDFPKGIVRLEGPTGERFLIVGGRGGYLTTYLLDDGEPIRVRDLYLPRPGYQSHHVKRISAQATAAA